MTSYPIQQISQGEFHATLNYFTLSPEGPDGSRVIYCRFDEVPVRGRPRTHPLTDAQLWICDRDGANHRPISDKHPTRAHTAMTQTWLDDDTIAYHDFGEELIHIHTLSTGEETTFPGHHISHYSPIADEILFSSVGSRSFPIKGVYAASRKGDVRMLAQVEEIEQFTPFGANADVPYDPDPWMMNHPYWSPDASTISFIVRIRGGLAFTMLVNPDGSNLRPWSRTEPRPMHYYWFDNESMYGHDHDSGGDRFARRYDMEGNRIETLSGPGCHGAISPDKQWVATEDWYGTDPTNLYLYRRGETEPTAILATQAVHQGRSCVHPVFSPDGQRVYFNYHVPDSDQARLYVADVSSLVG